MAHARYRSAVGAAALLLLVHAGPSFGPATEAVSPDVVISEVYGGGGNSGATLTHDFIELYNRGAAAVCLDGWSVQYGAAAGNLGNNSAGQLTPLSGLIQPGAYLLIRESQGAGGTTALPSPHLTDPSPIAMSATAGKVALVTDTNFLNCGAAATACAPNDPRIRDLVGYGATATTFEGAGPAPGTQNTTSVTRAGGGATDTDHNNADFTAGAPNPTAGPVAPCSATPALAINDVSVAEGDAGTTQATFTVSLSSPAGPAGVQFTVATQDGGAKAGLDYHAILPTGMSIGSGDLSATVAVTILGDFDVEPHETFFVDVSNVSGADVTDGQGLGTIQNDDVPLVAIHEIQGPDGASPYAGQSVATHGIVTARKTNGFFIQTPDSDDDGLAETSQGVFVFTGALPAVQIGDALRVTGTVVEFKSSSAALPGTLTEIGGAVGVTVLSTGNPLPAAVDAAAFDALASSRPAQLERYEGMLVHAASLMTVAPTNRFGELYSVLNGVHDRTFREPGLAPGDGPSGGAPPNVPHWDGNFERIMVDTDESLTAAGVRRAAIVLSSGGTLSPVSGPLDYAFDEYRINLAGDATPAVTPGIDLTAVGMAAAEDLTVGALNVQNLFPPSATPTPAQLTAFENRLTKTSLVVRDALRTPDILGLIEVGDLGVLQQLRDRINADAGMSYEAYLLEGIDGGGNDQDVGYLVNTARVHVVGAPFQEFKGVTFDFFGVSDILFDRPPFVLEATFRGMPVTVILNHLKSLIEVESNEPYLNTGHTVGERNREKRRLGAEYLADLIEARQHENLIVLGDMNAFEFNDGYGDILGTLMGSPAPADEVVAPSVDRWDHTLVNLAMGLPLEQRYSYVFEGNAQVLDHVLVTPQMHDRLASFAYARVNADFPETFNTDPSRPERLSDHDGPVAVFSPRASVSTATALPASVTAGMPFTYDITVSNAGPDPANGVTMTNGLPANAAFQSLAVPAGWNCSEIAGGVLSCEAASLAAGASATFVVSAVVDCGVGDGATLTTSTTVTSFTADDPSDNGSSDSAVVSNPTPAIGGVAASPSVIWPPNHRMTDVALGYVIEDNCGAVDVDVTVTSNEPVNGTGDGDTGPDWEIVNDTLVRVRAERSGGGTGRVYTVTVTATDNAGGSSSATTTILVPHSGKKK